MKNTISVIKYDLISLKKNIILNIHYIIFFILLALIFNESILLIGVYISATHLSEQLFVLDEKNNCFKAFGTLPVGVKNIVLSRFLISLLFSFFSIILTILLIFLSDYIVGFDHLIHPKIHQIIPNLSVSIMFHLLLVTTLISTISICFTFKYNVLKSQILALISVIIIIGISLILFKILPNSVTDLFTKRFITFTNEHTLIYGICVFVLVLIISVIGCIISIKILSKKLHEGD